MTQFDGYGVAWLASLIVIGPPQMTPRGDLADSRAVPREVSRGAAEFVPAPARTAMTKPKSNVPVARTENSVTRRPSGRADVMLPSPNAIGYLTFLQRGAGQFKSLQRNGGAPVVRERPDPF
jgi:hypothetical protein